MSLVAEVLVETVQIVMLVFVMMVLVDLFNLWSRGKLGELLAGTNRRRQYIVAPVLGAMPGCLGAFSTVSLYLHRLISFGALTGAMVAASGDEAFVMLAMFPKTAVLLFLLLAVLGVAVGWPTDRFIKRFGIQLCADCDVPTLHPLEHGVSHYLKEHLVNHILRRHIVRTALWTFGALLVVRFGSEYANLGGMTTQYPFVVLLLSALLGLIPESGPHLIIVTLFANGAVPFSVLLTSSIVQDGHGMLPMLAHSVRDSLLLKSINLVFGLGIGLALLLLGY